MGLMAPTGRQSENNASSRRPKYVTFAPGDEGEYLPDVFFEDPRTFSPKPGPMGHIHAWGLYPYTSVDDLDLKGSAEENNWPDFDGMQAAMRQMTYQTFYWGDNKSPENQFMDILLERKKKQLESLDLKGLDRCDVLCRIYLPGLIDRNGEHRVWRLFKVSAGISLSVFQDKVIAPVMGWVRNFHSYTLTDFRDGAMFGPEGSGSIDQVHIAQVGYKYLSDNMYKLAHLFGKAGDQIGYLYDYGDKWYHRIEIVKIIPQEESSGSVEVIEGKGMCPGENLHGNLQYADFLDEFDSASYSRQAEMKREILATPNYNSFGKPPSLVDPAVFDLDAAKARVAEALSSTTSVRSGAKKFHMPIMPGAEHIINQMDQQHLKKGQTIVNSHDMENYGFWNETVSTKRDARKEAVCGFCGKPASSEVQLKACAGCQQVICYDAVDEKPKSEHYATDTDNSRTRTHHSTNMADAIPQTDVSRPSALPTANLSQRGGVPPALVEQNSVEYLDAIEEEWNKKVDAEVDILVDGMVDLVGIASIGDKDKFRIAQESFQTESRAESMIRAANSLLSITHSMKLLLLLSDEAQIAHRRDAEMKVVQEERDEAKKQVEQILNELLKKPSGSTQQPGDGAPEAFKDTQVS
uniref:Plasmid pRiA4b Orf3-like domain-containing protein n=1 Tax=Psilocybe cubensis TaxID=181762 RepID=A0A8H7Y0B2_PSICU